MKTWKKIALPLALAFTLVGCGESPQDLAKKPEIVQQMVENSASICERGPVHGDNAAYQERLTKVLMGATTQNLQTLKDHNVTVCLDQRLPGQTRGFWTARMDGIYYGQKDGGIASLWDNGKLPAEVGFWDGMSTYYRGSQAVDRLASEVRNHSQAPDGGYMAAYEYGKYHRVSWSTQNPGEGSLAANPQLQKPPIKAPSPKPGS